MTSLLDVVTSESPDVNTSINFNVTVAGNNTEALTGHVSLSTVPVIAIVAILLIVSVLNLCGNGFTLITIRMTPRLRTKTNVIMTSMLLSYFMTSFSLICFNSYQLLANVYSSPCHFNVVITWFTFLIKMPGYVSALHTILVSVERYIAIVHPLQYETTFTDHTLKRAISAIWMIGIFLGMTFALWLIDADLRKCAIIPVHYQLLDVVIFTLVWICLLACYRKILAISWRQHRHIEPLQLANASPLSGPSLQTIEVATPTWNNSATTGNNIVDPNSKSLTSMRASSQPTVTSGTVSSELMQEQQQQLKSRRREFRAAFLIAAIVGAWAILSIPRMIARVLESVGYNPAITRYIMIVSGPLATLKFASTWVIYAAVSKSYRRAYRQMLIRIGCCCCKKVPPADNSLSA